MAVRRIQELEAEVQELLQEVNLRQVPLRHSRTALHEGMCSHRSPRPHKPVRASHESCWLAYCPYTPTHSLTAHAESPCAETLMRRLPPSQSRVRVSRARLCTIYAPLTPRMPSPLWSCLTLCPVTLPQEQEQVLKEALREVEREQQRVGFAERPVDMEYLKNTCGTCRI